ncbi:Transcriptional regulatory protein algP [Minicystis rosea]|nr:Transcriptional regulatory protein algP [Minicystis rosea]
MEAAEIDKELEELDTKIDQLRALYEQYFMGIERLEPQKPRQDVERRLKVLRREQIRNTAQRFKFNVLVQKLNTMQQYWNRVVREMENGTFKRDVLRAAARFGDSALTGVGKKRAKELSKLVSAKSQRVIDDTMELGADDLIEDDEDDDAPTPPKLEHGGPASARGLVPDDLPLIQAPPTASAPYAAPTDYAAMPVQYGAPHAAPAAQYGAPQAAQYGAPQAAQYGAPQAAQYGASPAIQYDASSAAQYGASPAAQHGGHIPQHDASSAAQYGASSAAQYGAPPGAQHGAPQAPPAGQEGGRRSTLTDPSSSIRPAPNDVKKRVTELAAEMRTARVAEAPARSFGSLDLDFDEAPNPRTSEPAPARTAVRAEPAASPARAAAAPPAPAAGGFGVLDIALDGDLGPPPSAPSPGSGIRMGGRPAVSARPSPAEPQRAQPAAAQPRPQPAPAGGDLADQRLRQIYAKYVETKRSVNESTAGVTYEKLAATLRAQTEKLKASHPSKAVDFEVVIKDGKTHLKPVLK